MISMLGHFHSDVVHVIELLPYHMIQTNDIYICKYCFCIFIEMSYIYVISMWPYMHLGFLL